MGRKILNCRDLWPKVKDVESKLLDTSPHLNVTFELSMAPTFCFFNFSVFSIAICYQVNKSNSLMCHISDEVRMLPIINHAIFPSFHSYRIIRRHKTALNNCSFRLSFTSELTKTDSRKIHKSRKFS